MIEQIGPQEVRDEVGGDTPPLLVDVREGWERETASIDPSVHVPLGEFAERAPQEVPHDADVVVYCHHGGRSARAAAWLHANGWERVRNLRGGIDAWSTQVDPAVDRY